MKRWIVSAALAVALAAAGVYAENPKAPAKSAPASPETVVIGALSAWYGPVTFTHAKHADLAGDCSSCHHMSDGETAPCSTCHAAQPDPSDPSTLTLKVAYHDRCVACHKTAGSGPTGCTDCHAKVDKGAAPAPAK
jgi:hypothetical protein